MNKSNLHRRGFSLVELMVVCTVMVILVSMATPSFRRSMEQSRADMAGANLRAIWTAQRVYWLEYRTYTNDLSVLESLDLLDPTIGAATTRYVYAISAADDDTFLATATRSGSDLWTGQFTIDEDGTVSGVVQALGKPDITPGFL